MNATQPQPLDPKLRPKLQSDVGTTDDHDNVAAELQGSSALDRPALVKSNARVLSLPFEILHLILEYAIPPNIFLPPSINRGPYSAWSQTLHQIKFFILVCRMWRDVGYDLLYRDVVLRRIGQIPALLHSLQGNLRLHPMVRSLQIVTVVSCKHHAVFEHDVTRILSLCPNIKRLSFRHETEGICRDLPSIPCSVLSSISELDIGPSYHWPLVFSSLVQCTHLIILTINLCGFVSADGIPSAEFGSLEELHCILDIPGGTAVKDVFSCMAERWSLPRLKRLTLGHHNVAHSGPFLRVHGQKLNFLAIAFVSNVYSDDCASPSLPISLQNALHLCPSLQHLVLDSVNLCLELFHPEVRYIDIWTHMLDSFPDVSEHFPALKHGRLLSLRLLHPGSFRLPILVQPGPPFRRSWTYPGLDVWHDSTSLRSRYKL